MAALPSVYRHIAGLAGVEAAGIPPFLGAGRSETALFALALDLNNDDLLTASGGKLPFDDPFAARYLPARAREGSGAAAVSPAEPVAV